VEKFKYIYFFFVGFASEQALIGHANANGNHQFLILVLLSLLQIKCQNSGNSPFDTHVTIMPLLIIVIYFYGVAYAAITRQNPNRSYIYLVVLICDILGALASSLLILILLPSFGRFLLVLCAFVLSLKALHSSNWKIFELLLAFKCQVSSTFKRSHQASNDNSMEQEGNGGVLPV
jgi:uncharacterized membrane protein YfcA